MHLRCSRPYVPALCTAEAMVAEKASTRGMLRGFIGARDGHGGFPICPCAHGEAQPIPAGVAAAGQRAARKHAVRSRR